jgi:nucleoside-diphosphate-sugar epimerase
MNYLITGGTGFIGSRFIKTLSSKKDFVIILSRKKTGEVNNCRVIDTLSLGTVNKLGF